MKEVTAKIWIEKWRPQTLNETVLSLTNRSILENALKKPKEFPNLFLYSRSPGTGKTTIGYIIVNELKADSLILNASDERGIDTIREKVKEFAQLMSFNPDSKKCVVLNESDGLTSQALNSLRDIMETYASNVFFILTANNKDKVIEPIRSRCIELNFSVIPQDKIKIKMEEICKSENLEVESGQLEKLIKSKYPDIRSMVGTLQEVSLGRKLEDVLEEDNKNITILRQLEQSDFKPIIEQIQSDEINVGEFVDWLFDWLLKTDITFQKQANICKLLVQMESLLNDNVNSNMILLSSLEDLRKEIF
jgi:DNA polymerase III delta prime subunit